MSYYHMLHTYIALSRVNSWVTKEIMWEIKGIGSLYLVRVNYIGIPNPGKIESIVFLKGQLILNKLST